MDYTLEDVELKAQAGKILLGLVQTDSLSITERVNAANSVYSSELVELKEQAAKILLDLALKDRAAFNQILLSAARSLANKYQEAENKVLASELVLSLLETLVKTNELLDIKEKTTVTERLLQLLPYIQGQLLENLKDALLSYLTDHVLRDPSFRQNKRLLTEVSKAVMRALKQNESDERYKIALNVRTQVDKPEVVRSKLAQSSTKRDKLFIETKFMGHRFNLTGIDPKFAPAYRLSGYNATAFYKELVRHWNEIIEQPFAQGFWGDNQAALKAYFSPLNKSWENIGKFDAATTAQAINSGKPCSIPMNFSNHYFSISINGDVLCINNRGAQSQRDDFESTDRTAFNEGTLGLRFINIKDHKRQFSEDFLKRLVSGDRMALRLLYRMPTLYEYTRKPQKRGNCTLTQSKADYQAHLIYFAASVLGINLTQASPEEWQAVIAEVEPLYHDFALYDRAQGLANYSALETNEPHHAAIRQEGRIEMNRLAAKQNGNYSVIKAGSAILADEA